MAKITIMVRSAQYGMATAGEGFRAIIGTAGMGFDTYAVLIDDGVFVALKDQNAEKIEMHNLAEAYKQISDFGAHLIIHKESMEKRDISEYEIIAGKIIDTKELKNILRESKFVISFI